MTKFDFKQWIINNKHGNKSKSLNEGFPDLTGDGEVTYADILKGRGVDLDYSKNEGEGMCEMCGMAHEGSCGMMNEVSMLSCEGMGNPSSECHGFSQCIGGVDDMTTIVYQIGSAFANSEDFWIALGSPSNIGDIIEVIDNSGNKQNYIYKGAGFDQDMDPADPANYTSPSVGCCGALGCTDNTATNYDPTAVCDDGNCSFATVFTECINCCCKSFLQSEGVNPTIDRVVKLMEQADRRRPSNDRMASRGTGGNDGTDKIKRGGADKLGMSSISPSQVQTNTIMGNGCANNSVFTPNSAAGNIDPSTGICDCNNNNPYGGATVQNSHINPVPGSSC